EHGGTAKHDRRVEAEPGGDLRPPCQPDGREHRQCVGAGNRERHPGRRDKRARNVRVRVVVIASLAFVFGIWACYGTGKDSLFYGTLMLLAGLPLYVWQTGKAAKAK
ncbi:MAG: hypothetical protein ACHQAZ_08995, partial [Gammaproteobacteria bacterium]